MNIKTIIMFLILMLCGGCTIKYEDISNRPEYKPLIGATYVLTNAMYISGVNAPPGYETTIDYYVIDPLDHNWSGPEKITEDTLPEGTRLTVKNIQKPLTYFLGDRIRSEVDVTPYKTKENHPIYIGLKDLKRSGCIDNRK